MKNNEKLIVLLNKSIHQAKQKGHLTWLSTHSASAFDETLESAQ